MRAIESTFPHQLRTDFGAEFLLLLGEMAELWLDTHEITSKRCVPGIRLLRSAGTYNFTSFLHDPGRAVYILTL